MKYFVKICSTFRFVVYKLPEGKTSGTSGGSYVYRSSDWPADREVDDTFWIRSERMIGDVDSLPGHTLQPLYANEQVSDPPSPETILFKCV